MIILNYPVAQFILLGPCEAFRFPRIRVFRVSSTKYHIATVLNRMLVCLTLPFDLPGWSKLACRHVSRPWIDWSLVTLLTSTFHGMDKMVPNILDLALEVSVGSLSSTVYSTLHLVLASFLSSYHVNWDWPRTNHAPDLEGEYL